MAHAQQHYIAAGAWQAAADMLSSHGHWEGALQVAKEHGGEGAHMQVLLDPATHLKPTLTTVDDCSCKRHTAHKLTCNSRLLRMR